jgi:hypothetical protein
MLKKIGKKNIFSLFLYFLLSLFITFPLIFNLTSFITGYGDELITAWLYNWNIYNYSSNLPNLLHIFNANNYFPYSNSLAFSDAGFTNSFLMLIPVLILKSPVVVNNLTLILSLTLVGFFTYLLSNFLTKNNLVSLLSGILIIFCPAYLSNFSNIQIVSIYFVPLSILLLLKFLKTEKPLYFYLFLASFILQAYNSFFPGYFIFFTSVIICLFYLRENKRKIKILFTKNNILALVISFCLVALIAIPYFKVSKEFNYVRDIRDSIHLSLQPEDFLSSNDFGYTRLNNFLSTLPFSVDTYGKGEVKPGFLGLTFSILFLFSFFFILKNWKKQNYVLKGIFVSAILGLLLSLGPFLHIQRFTIHNPFPIPLPYALFYYLVPGFMGIRNAARFEMFFIIFAAPIIAFSLKTSLNKLLTNKKNLLVLLLIVFVILEFNFPMKFYKVSAISEFPKVYSWLSDTPKSTAIVEMPIYNWNNPYAAKEFWREYYSTQDFRKRVNGISGFSPPPWQDLVNYLLVSFPSQESINKLKSISVNLILVHKDEYDILYKDNYQIIGRKMLNGNDVIKLLKENKSIYLEKQFGDDYIFKIK